MNSFDLASYRQRWSFNTINCNIVYDLYDQVFVSFQIALFKFECCKKSIFLQTMFILDYVRYAYDGCQSREGNVLSENFLRNCCVTVHFKIFNLFNLKLFGRLK